MTRLFMATVMLAAFAATSDAGWLRDRVAAKRGTCSDGTCSAVAPSNGGSVTTTACANGKCDLPMASPKLSSAVDTIVIDGKAYRLTPIGPP